MQFVFQVVGCDIDDGAGRFDDDPISRLDYNSVVRLDHDRAVSPANFNSCSIVTQAEAASAIGAPVTKGVLGNATVEGGLACVFYGTSAPTPTTPNVAQPDPVRVVDVKGTNALRWYTDYESKVRPQPISGYGRLAFYDGAASLNILKGNCYLRIAVVPSGTPPSLTDEEQLAKVILPKV